MCRSLEIARVECLSHSAHVPMVMLYQKLLNRFDGMCAGMTVHDNFVSM
jgi:hypothetical protein